MSRVPVFFMICSKINHSHFFPAILHKLHAPTSGCVQRRFSNISANKKFLTSKRFSGEKANSKVHSEFDKKKKTK